MHTTSWKRNPDSACIAGTVQACEGRYCLRSVRAQPPQLLLMGRLGSASVCHRLRHCRQLWLSVSTPNGALDGVYVGFHG
jgi:hypothetical protein